MFRVTYPQEKEKNDTVQVLRCMLGYLSFTSEPSFFPSIANITKKANVTYIVQHGILFKS